jgi:hypothetical protein
MKINFNEVLGQLYYDRCDTDYDKETIKQAFEAGLRKGVQIGIGEGFAASTNTKKYFTDISIEWVEE